MRITLVSGLAGLSLLVLSACTSVAPIGEIPASIANATTAGDHQKIADYFARKAADYEAEADAHERMKRSYSNSPRAYPGSMTAHCTSLKHKFTEAAQEARVLEQAHRQLAQDFKR